MGFKREGLFSLVFFAPPQNSFVWKEILGNREENNMTVAIDKSLSGVCHNVLCRNMTECNMSSNNVQSDKLLIGNTKQIKTGSEKLIT